MSSTDVNDEAHVGHRSTSVKTDHTTSIGASIVIDARSTPVFPIPVHPSRFSRTEHMYQMVHRAIQTVNRMPRTCERPLSRGRLTGIRICVHVCNKGTRSLTRRVAHFAQMLDDTRVAGRSADGLFVAVGGGDAPYALEESRIRAVRGSGRRRSEL